MPNDQITYRTLSEKLDLPPFYRPEYLDLCYGHENWAGLTNTDIAGNPVLWPVGMMNKLGFNRILQHYFTPRSGIWSADPGKLDPATVSDLIVELPKFQHFHQSFPVGFAQQEIFREDGFHLEKRTTYFLDLTIGTEALWSNMRPDYRNNKIRKAEGRFQLIEDVPVEEFFRIHQMTYERQQIPIYYSTDFLKKWNDLIREKGWGQLYGAADENGEICSVAAVLYGGRTAWLLKAGDDPTRRNEGSGIWLQWQIIKNASLNGLEIFDFLGSMVPGIARVRKQFGGIATEYWSISRKKGLVYPTARMVFSLFNRG